MLIFNTLQMKVRWESNINVWFPFLYSQKWNRAASLVTKQNYNVLSPNSYTPISVRDLYISRINLSIFDRSWECKSLTDTRMWKLGLRLRNSQKRNTSMGFSLQCSMQNAIYDSCYFLNLLQLSENLFSHMSQEEQRELALQYSSGDSHVKVMQFCLFFFINFLFLYNKQ